MKTKMFPALMVLLMFISFHELWAQTTESKLNQIELMKQLLGNWETKFSDGNSMILDFIAFGNAMVGNAKFVTKDTIIHIITEFWGYDDKNDKIIVAELYNNTPVMEIDVLWFSSKSTIEGVLLQDRLNPENAALKYRIEIKSPDTFLMITVPNNAESSILTWTRTKM
jgi:hypothetical protein